MNVQVVCSTLPHLLLRTVCPEIPLSLSQKLGHKCAPEQALTLQRRATTWWVAEHKCKGAWIPREPHGAEVPCKPRSPAYMRGK